MPSTRRALPTRKDIALAGEKTERIPVNTIDVQGGTQMRAGLNADIVDEYSEWLKELAAKPNGLDQMPPIEVYYDGDNYWLADGFHRLAAWRRCGFLGSDQRTPLDIQAVVHAGTRRDAILHAAGANADHGLRRTNADKRRAVTTLLRDEEWRTWSDHEIARRCKVDPKTVGNIRRDLVGTGELPQLTLRKTADGRVMDTEKIGSNQIGRIRQPKPAPAVEPRPEGSRPVDTEEPETKKADGEHLITNVGWLVTEEPDRPKFQAALMRATLDELAQARELLAPGGIKGDTVRVSRIDDRLRYLKSTGITEPPAAEPANPVYTEEPESALAKTWGEVLLRVPPDSDSFRLSLSRASLAELDAVLWEVGWDAREKIMARIEERWPNVRWLIGTPAHDINFKTALERCTLEELQEALEHIPDKPGHKTRTEAIERRIKHLEATPAVGLDRDWSQDELDEYAEANRPITADDAQVPVTRKRAANTLAARDVAEHMRKRIEIINQLDFVYANARSMLYSYETQTGDFQARSKLTPVIDDMREKLKHLRTILETEESEPDGDPNA